MEEDIKEQDKTAETEKYVNYFFQINEPALKTGS
jgi:hypothetical protein